VSVAFDTLKFAQTLRDKAKLSAEQAEGIAQAFAEASGEQLATKADLAVLERKLDGLATKDELKEGLAETKAELLKWMFGQTLLLIGVLMALLRFGH
jgi:hypothetical protein